MKLPPFAPRAPAARVAVKKCQGPAGRQMDIGSLVVTCPIEAHDGIGKDGERGAVLHPTRETLRAPRDRTVDFGRALRCKQRRGTGRDVDVDDEVIATYETASQPREKYPNGVTMVAWGAQTKRAAGQRRSQHGLGARATERERCAARCRNGRQGRLYCFDHDA